MKSIVLFLIFCFVNLLAGNIFSGLRLDLTDGNLYSLSKGSSEILDALTEPVSLKFYYSETESSDFPQLATYARRVRELLEEYRQDSNGKIRLEVFDVRPDSDEESWAARYGLSPFPGPSGKQLFLGLVADGGKEESISVFDPTREAFLEYDITRLIYTSSTAEKVRVGLYSGVELKNEDESEFASIQTLKESFDLTEIEDFSELEQFDLLIVVHPKSDELEEDSLIDFVRQGKNVLLFVDGFNSVELDQGRVNGADVVSKVPEFLSEFGLKLTNGLVADPNLATNIRDAQGQERKFLLFSRLGPDQLSDEFVATAELEDVVLPWPGALEVTEKEGVSSLILAAATEKAGLVDYGKLNGSFVNPDLLWRSHVPSEKDYAFAVLSKVEGGGSIVVVSDSDILNDAYSVRVQSFFGRRLTSLINDNLPFVQNLAEQLSGSDSLISLRSRGVSRRPFVVVEEIETEAKDRWRKEEEKLKNKLQEVNQKLQQLQQDKSVLTSDLVEEVNKFKEARYQAQQRLREVRRNSRKEVESLEHSLFALNSFLVPFLLLAGYFIKVRN